MNWPPVIRSNRDFAGQFLSMRFIEYTGQMLTIDTETCICGGSNDVQHQFRLSLQLFIAT
jgi:hypothetical protein